MQMNSGYITFLFLFALLMSVTNFFNDYNAVAAKNDESSFYEHLSKLEISDLKQMLHEKNYQFYHLRTKEELIQALIEIYKQDEIMKNFKTKVNSNVEKHVLRVEYCSG